MTNQPATGTAVARRLTSFAQIQKDAGMAREDNAITKEMKETFARSGVPFVITDMEADEGDNGPYWKFTIELGKPFDRWQAGDEVVFFQGENQGNQELFERMYAEIEQGAAVGPMVLQWVDPYTTKKGQKRNGFYKLEPAEVSTIDVALERTQQQLLAANDLEELPF
jgi:hypothetical protein